MRTRKSRRTQTHILPDVLAHHLDIIFCGTAAGNASARRGAYYAGPGNRFWPTLHQVGLIPRPIEAQEYRRITDWNLGLTDLAKAVSGCDSILSAPHFQAARLRRLLLRYQPSILAFTGKRAAEEFLSHKVDYGLLQDTVETTRLFVLPSPSGAARRFWNEQHWQELALLRNQGALDADCRRRVVSPPRTLRL